MKLHSMPKALFYSLFLFVIGLNGLAATTDQETKIIIRSIGHDFLLGLNDSTSRILPIKKVKERFRLSFENEFSFEPDLLLFSTLALFEKHQLKEQYLVEVQQCDSSTVVYSFMASLNPEENLMPCKLRKLPYACYEIYFTVIQNFSQAEVVTRTNENPPKNTKLAAVFSVLFLSFLPFIFIYARKKRKQPPIDSGHIEIGQFQFDPKKMQLILKKQSIELSSKESDLLFLLVTNENQTLKREFILKEIWGDEGDYIGRTLDVFISKLRKKLAADAQLKIINIRGVGYRFVKN